jgi:transposase
MEHYQKIECPYCGSSHLTKNGHSPNKTQRWRCLLCKKCFQLNYTYTANQPHIKEQIDIQTLNSSGVRDIARNLKINPNTVCSHLKKKRQQM